LDEQRCDGMQLAPAHVLDLLGNVRPIEIRVVHPFSGGDPSQQLALAFRPGQDVGVVEIAHGAPPGQLPHIGLGRSAVPGAIKVRSGE